MKHITSVLIPSFRGGSNIIYNPELKNTAKDFFSSAKSVPTNPDGYLGDCCVKHVGKKKLPTLITNDDVIYKHYGIPYGEVCYSVKARGNGNIGFYLRKNNTHIDADTNGLEMIGEIIVDSSCFDDYSINLNVPDNPKQSYDDVYEGMGEKVVALEIVYSDGLEVQDIVLSKM